MKNNASESIPKEEGFRLELIDTISVPMWLYDAYVMGKDYYGNLTFTEQEKLADFREQYSSYHLDNHDEEAQYRGTNEFDGMGGLCYDVDVYKRSSDESKKNESKDETSRQDFDIDCESCIQALDEMKKKVLEWKEQGYDGVDDPYEVSLLRRALRDVESKFEIR